MKKNKLLITSPYFYPHTGGLENYVYNIAKGLAKKKWDVVVVTSNHVGKKKKTETIDGIKIYRLPTLIRISNTPINPFWYFELKKIIDKEKPDLINSHSPVPFMLNITAMCAGKTPFVITYHSGTMKKGKIYTDLPIWIYEKFFLTIALRRSTKIICSSDFVKKTMFKNYSKKSSVISPAVDVSIFKPKKNKSTSTVLFIARHANMYKLKGLDYLIDAIDKIPSAKLNVVGEKVKNKNKKITYLGPKSGKDLAKEIQKSSVVVLPTIANMESFGMVLIEAMACKIPVIGTNNCGIADVITDKKDGLIIPPKNSLAIERSIKRILGNKIMARKMGENGYKKVMKNYLWEYKVTQTNNLFLNLLNV